MSVVLLLFMPLAAASLLVLWRPAAAAARALGLLVALLLVLGYAGVVLRCGDGEVLRYALGGWPAPFGIALRVDRLGALFLLLQALLLLICLFALRPACHGEATVRRALPPLLMASFGLAGAFMTGDWFNLFVMYEVVLVSTYLLLQVPGGDRALVAALPMIVINMLASALFLAGMGLLYGIGGALNMESLAAALPAAPPALRLAALGLLLAAFATKAALVPLCFWMPASYPTLSAPLAAFMAGVMTKLGVYSLLRAMPLLTLEPVLLDTLVWVGAASALLGVLAALSQYEMRRLLSFHSVSQIGYMVLATGLATLGGFAAAILFALHHSLVKSCLYLVADELERSNGSRDLRQMCFTRSGGWPVALVFALVAFALAGVPPLSGFLGKLAVFRATMDSGGWAVLLLLVLASVFTLASMLKIWRFAFQRRPLRPGEALPVPRWPPAAASLAAVVIAFSLAAGSVYRYGLAAAEQVMAPRVVEVVHGAGSR